MVYKYILYIFFLISNFSFLLLAVLEMIKFCTLTLSFNFAQVTNYSSPLNKAWIRVTDLGHNKISAYNLMSILWICGSASADSTNHSSCSTVVCIKWTCNFYVFKIVHIKYVWIHIKYVKYHVWNEMPVQVQCTILDAWG